MDDLEITIIIFLAFERDPLFFFLILYFNETINLEVETSKETFTITRINNNLKNYVSLCASV